MSIVPILAVGPIANSIVVGGLALGGLYALIAVGFTVIYKATRAVNFAQGAFTLVGAYLYWTFTFKLGATQPEGLVAVTACCVVMGIAVYWLLLRRMAGADEFLVIIVTLGLSLVVTSLLAIIYGLDTHYIAVGSKSVLSLAGFRFTLLQVAALLISAVSIIALTVLSHLTRWGVVMRSVAENPLLSGLYGVNVDLVGAGAWAIGIALSGLAGVVFAAQTGVTQAVSAVGLVAFPAIMLGGIDSIPGGIIGGLIIGYVVTVITTENGPTIANLAAYGLLVAALLVRPQGLLGTKAARSV